MQSFRNKYRKTLPPPPNVFGYAHAGLLATVIFNFPKIKDATPSKMGVKSIDFKISGYLT